MTTQVTLAMLQQRAIDQVKNDDNAQSILDSGAAGTAAMLGEYLMAQSLDIAEAPKTSKVFEDACEVLRAGYRSQYCYKQRHVGNKKNRRPVNMELAAMVLDSTEQTREGWAKDSTERQIWDSILGFGRTKLQRVLQILWPKTTTTGSAGFAETTETNDAAATTEKATPTADAVLANLDAFLAKHGKDSAIAKTLREQINLRFK